MATIERRAADGQVARAGYVPERCQRAPNARLDRAFGLYVCNQREPRCRFYGPVYIQGEDGRQYECRARDSV